MIRLGQRLDKLQHGTKNFDTSDILYIATTYLIEISINYHHLFISFPMQSTKIYCIVHI